MTCSYASPCFSLSIQLSWVHLSKDFLFFGVTNASWWVCCKTFAFIFMKASLDWRLWKQYCLSFNVRWVFFITKKRILWILYHNLHNINFCGVLGLLGFLSWSDSILFLGKYQTLISPVLAICLISLFVFQPDDGIFTSACLWILTGL